MRPRVSVYAEINLGRLTGFAEGETIDPAVSGRSRTDTGGQQGQDSWRRRIQVKLTLRAHAFSGSAREQIAALGGIAEVIEDLKH